MAQSSVIAAGTELRGRLTADSDLHFSGRMTGEITVRGELTIAPGARVEGPLQARTVTVAGEVRGPIRGQERVEIVRGGSVAGDIVAARVALAAGSELDGEIDIDF